jgi:hypothetical protein
MPLHRRGYVPRARRGRAHIEKFTQLDAENAQVLRFTERKQRCSAHRRSAAIEQDRQHRRNLRKRAVS